MKKKKKQQLLIGIMALTTILIGGIVYFTIFREHWVSAASFQEDLKQIGSQYNIQRSCEEWITRMHSDDGGPLIMRGPFRLCHKIGRKYAKKAYCKEGEMFILCGQSLEN